jgi:hypothetical protein
MCRGGQYGDFGLADRHGVGGGSRGCGGLEHERTELVGDEARADARPLPSLPAGQLAIRRFGAFNEDWSLFCFTCNAFASPPVPHR